MNLTEIVVDVQAVQAAGDNVIKLVETYVPSVSSEAELAGAILDLTSQMVQAALTAWSNANNQPITPETIAALMPDSTPLTAPDA